MYDYEDEEEDMFGSPPPVRDRPEIDFKAALNEEQFRAVTAPDGPALVLAGAGSGKTRTLTYRVAYLLSQGVSPEAILLLTFTNKAAKQMLDRVEQLTGVGSHRFLGGTFHSVGGQVLRLFGDSVGLVRNFTILDDGDSDSLLNEVIRDLDPSFFKTKENPKAKPIKGLISFARNIGSPVEDIAKGRYPANGELLARIDSFARAYQETKIERGLADYDDLLVYWLEVLQNNEEAARYYQERFSHVLVDEYQDVNSLQAGIVDKIGAKHQIMAVGDDAQCIYTWRGADIDQIMEFPNAIPGRRFSRSRPITAAPPKFSSWPTASSTAGTRKAVTPRFSSPHAPTQACPSWCLPWMPISKPTSCWGKSRAWLMQGPATRTSPSSTGPTTMPWSYKWNFPAGACLSSSPAD